MKKYLFLATLMISLPLTAALPPLYQSVAELKMLLDDPELGKNIPSSEVIQDIWHQGNHYIITTTNMTLNVEVIPLPSKGPGPAQFRLEFKLPRNVGE